MNALGSIARRQFIRRNVRFITKEYKASCECETLSPSTDAMPWIKGHARHIFVTTRDEPGTWSAYPELQGPALDLDVSIMAHNKSTKSPSSRILSNTCFPIHPPRTLEDDDECLVFPSGTRSTIHSTLAELTRGDGHQELHGPQIFICSHGARDSRCGLASTLLTPRIKSWVQRYGRGRVYATTHLGGHKFAGLLLVYLPSTETKDEKDGEWSCAWYGKVTPDNLDCVLDSTIRDRKVVPELVRYTSGIFTQPACSTETGMHSIE